MNETEIRELVVLLRRRFNTTHVAWARTAPTKSIHAGFASIDAAIAKLEHAVEVKPSPMAAPLVSPAENVRVTSRVTCPECKNPRADRGHVEQNGCCYDCWLLLKKDKDAAKPCP